MSTQRVNTRAWAKFKREFFQQGKTLDEAGDPAANCWLCGQRVDYTVPPNSTPDSHNLDHFYPVASHPNLQHDPANARHSHQDCNVRRGKDAPMPGIGILSRDW
ncbi:hypothetical protein [Microbacterium soli]|uniref:HNH domain-containing protein n=1 Tax=Microbacterium soli TaxID=446075 RepID=A0ABP7NIR1_9MICO